MDSLKDRRELLFTKFTNKSKEVYQMNNILRERNKEHIMEMRNNTEHFKIDMAHTERLRKSAGIQMQIIANKK